MKNGFDVDILGIQRIKLSGNRWHTAYKNNGVQGLKDTRKDNSGRPLGRELTIEEKYQRIMVENNLLKAENELLKKLEMMERGDEEKEIKLVAKQKYCLIKSVITKYKLKNMTSYSCKIAGVLRSGYYTYFSVKSVKTRESRDKQDELVKDIILKAFKYKRRKKGLEGKFGVTYNLKRIRRIMKKHNIICTIRKPNSYKRMIKVTKEHTVVPNKLNREFKQNIPGKVLLTDITYLFYGKGKKAYLSTIKDSYTNEILAYSLSESLKLDIVINTIDILINEKKDLLTKDFIIQVQHIKN